MKTMEDPRCEFVQKKLFFFKFFYFSNFHILDPRCEFVNCFSLEPVVVWPVDVPLAGCCEFWECLRVVVAQLAVVIYFFKL